jgi:transposase
VQVAYRALEDRVAKLEAQVADLLDRLKVNSSNSSKPPSSDYRGKARPGKGPSGRNPGGQKGHPGAHREAAAPHLVTHVVNHYPDACEHCGCGLGADDDPEPLIHQVTDIPFAPPEVTEHRRHRRKCPACAKTTLAQLPPDVPAGAFGIGVQAAVAYYTGARRCSRREVVRIFHDVHNIDMSVGTVTALEEKVSDALEVCYAEATEVLPKSPVVHQDETSWREGGEKAWLWLAANTFIAVFLIAKSRKGENSQKMLEGFEGFLVSDRFKGYMWYEMAKRAICHAHLKRDFQRIADRGGKSEPIGQKLLAEHKLLFETWHAFKNGPLDSDAFYKRIKPIRARIMRWLRMGARCGEKKTVGACKDMIVHFPAMWTFIYEDGVEPTNNYAERILRKAVLWRKGSFGTQSPGGSRFVERILTVVESCKLQARCAFQFLLDTLRASHAGNRPPSLIPVATTQLQT